MKQFRRHTFAAVLSIAALGATAALTAASAEDQADMILTNGDIVTPKGSVQAMAVERGVIIGLGDAAAVDKYKTGKTKVIDLKGATVLPGLHDMHVHPMGAGLAQLQCRFPQGSSLAIVQKTLAGCVKDHAKGEWITGGQWDATSIGSPPNRAMLDKVAPDNPVVLTDISGHSAWANSKALQVAGITAKTPNPPGGIIERDAKGEPTGVFREAGANMVRSKVPPATPEQNVKALKWALDKMLSYGITSLTDAAVGIDNMEAYDELSKDGELKQRVVGCIMWRPGALTGGSPVFDEAIQRRNLYATDRFSPSCIKIFLDGVPTDGHTAAMLDPYADAKDPHSFRAKGLLMMPQKVLDRAVTRFDAEGLTVKFHAAGDAAVREALNAIEAARNANGPSGNLHDPGHNSFVKMSDIKRGRALAATFEMSPYIWYPNPIIPDIEKAIGPERMKRWIPVKDAIDSGALVVPGSDWSVVPSVNPWIAIETLVTRQKPGGGGEVLGAQERITLKQAMDMFTVNSAILMKDRNLVGTIEPGMLADLVVTDRDPYKIPVTDIHNTKVKMTIINGEVVYEATSD